VSRALTKARNERKRRRGWRDLDGYLAAVEVGARWVSGANSEYQDNGRGRHNPDMSDMVGLKMKEGRGRSQG
jgi:hypothetical protein